MRHAQAPPAAYGSPGDQSATGAALTSLGCAQARRMGEALAARGARVDYAVSGALPRQRQTMNIALHAAGSEVRPDVDGRWDEYDIDAILGGGGRAATTAGRELQTLVDDALARWVAGDSTAPAAEAYAAYQDRCARALETASALAGPGKTVLVVTSSGSITQILTQLWGLDGVQWIRMGRTMINASITKLIVGRTGISVVSMNEHGHLEGVDEPEHGPSMTFR